MERENAPVEKEITDLSLAARSGQVLDEVEWDFRDGDSAEPTAASNRSHRTGTLSGPVELDTRPGDLFDFADHPMTVNVRWDGNQDFDVFVQVFARCVPQPMLRGEVALHLFVALVSAHELVLFKGLC